MSSLKMKLFGVALLVAAFSLNRESARAGWLHKPKLSPPGHAPSLPLPGVGDVLKKIHPPPLNPHWPTIPHPKVHINVPHPHGHIDVPHPTSGGPGGNGNTGNGGNGDDGGRTESGP